jgi:hypothetical protein
MPLTFSETNSSSNLRSGRKNTLPIYRQPLPSRIHECVFALLALERTDRPKTLTACAPPEPSNLDLVREPQPSYDNSRFLKDSAKSGAASLGRPVSEKDRQNDQSRVLRLPIKPPEEPSNEVGLCCPPRTSAPVKSMTWTNDGTERRWRANDKRAIP